MSLVLSTLRCPPGVSPQRREVVRGALSIGRGAECDGVLPIEALRLISNVSAAAFTPFVSAASAALMGFEQWSDLSRPRDLANPDFSKARGASELGL